MDCCIYNSELDTICNEILQLPAIPRIPQIVLCLHFPGTNGWKQHWLEFRKLVQEFHRSMIDFNWRILEWYQLKSKQLRRFGRRADFLAGSILYGPHTTLIFTKPISESDVIFEVRKCLPRSIADEVWNLERTGHKLFLARKVFLFNNEQLICIDYGGSVGSVPSNIDCLKFSLYYENTKVDLIEATNRVYGGLISSFLIGGVGGLLSSYITGFFHKASGFSRGSDLEMSLLNCSACRFIACALSFSLLERVLLLKYSKPEKILLSGTAGALIGFLFSFSDHCSWKDILVGSSSYCLFCLTANLFTWEKKKNRIGNFVVLD